MSIFQMDAIDFLGTLADGSVDLVIDPFCGSGSVGVAALELGRHFIGNDKSAKAVGLAKERCLDLELDDE